MIVSFNSSVDTQQSHSPSMLLSVYVMVNGSWVNGSNGSVFWMGHMGHGSMHFHLHIYRKHVVKALS